MNELPNQWEMVTFEDVVEVNPRKSVDLEPDSLVTFVPMAAVNEVTGTIVESTLRPLQEVNKGFKQFTDNDVIFAKITPSMENGKSAIATGLENNIGFGSTEFHIFRSFGTVLPEYLWRFIRQQSFRDDAKRVMSGAVGQQRVPADYLKSYPLPLPPLAEQKRIVTKIGSMATRTTRVRTALDQIKALVDMYKARVLELAFTGKLTEDFRDSSNSHDVRINGYPPGWNVKTLGEIGYIQGGIQIGKKRTASAELAKVPYLRVANVQRGWLNLDEIKTVAVTSMEKERLLLQHGDILMNEGGDRDKLGRGWVWEGQITECIHQNHVFRIRLKDKSFPSYFVSHYANEKGQQYFFEQGTQTTNLASISKRKLAALPIPVPPEDEAIAIVDRIESTFAWIDRLMTEHFEVTNLLQRLDAAIYSSAFRGELVPQNPEDKPASVGVARALAKRGAASKPEKKGKISKPKETTCMARSLESILTEAGGWIPAQEVFRRCGVADGADTDTIEALYTELRMLDKAGRLHVETVKDEQGRKLYDNLKLKGV